MAADRMAIQILPTILEMVEPKFVLLLASNIPDTKLLLDEFSEFGLSGGKFPLAEGGTNIGTPELRDLVNPDVLNRLIASQSDWPGNGQEDLVTRFVAWTKEPRMTQDACITYADMMIFRYALGTAGMAERPKVAEAIRGMDVHDGAACSIRVIRCGSIRRGGGRMPSLRYPVAGRQGSDGLSRGCCTGQTDSPPATA